MAACAAGIGAFMSSGLVGWLKIVIVGLVISTAVYGCHKRSVRQEEAAALRQKIESNFDSYVRAAPLLKGAAAETFNDVADRKLHYVSTPSERKEWEAQGLSRAQQWRKAQAAIAKRKKEEEELGRQIVQKHAANMAAMAPVIALCEENAPDFDCHDMVETWLCMRGQPCSDDAVDSLETWAQEDGWCRENDGKCEDSDYVD